MWFARDFERCFDGTDFSLLDESVINLYDKNLGIANRAMPINYGGNATLRTAIHMNSIRSTPK